MDNKFIQFFNKYPIKSYNKRQIILRPESGDHRMFLVKSGFVRAHTTTEEGNEFSVVLVGPGMYFPSYRLLSHNSSSRRLFTEYYYSSVTPVDIAAAGYGEISTFLDSNPQLVKKMSEVYYRGVEQLLSELEFMVYTHSALKRVCHFLLFLCERFGIKNSGYSVIIPSLTHKEFATFVGLSREAVSHQFSFLKEHGVIKRHGTALRVKNISWLEKELTR